MENILSEAEKYVQALLTDELDHTFFYHNLSHTQRVVKATKALIEGESITEENDILALELAAWFHDTGYTEGTDEHELLSTKLAKTFLENHNLDADIIDKVSQLIMATKMGYEPVNNHEKIIRDADSSHFASKSYTEQSDLLREEWEALGIRSYKDIDWLKENIDFFTKHHRFYTDFANDNWQKRKDKNLAALFKSLRKKDQDESKKSIKKEELKLKKVKAALPERGIETMFRVTLRNHITLSDIADTKANILLSVNAIIVSLVLSNLIPKLDNPSNAHLIYPTVIFVMFTITAMILSVLATRPNVTSGKFTKADVKAKKVNLIFFGNFHKMELEDFEWAMGEMMQDRDYLYSSMKKDLYFLGKVLNRKYKILRLTYTIFIIGIIISVISFGVAFHFYSTPVVTP